MKRSGLFALSLSLLLTTNDTRAYEQATHALLTQAAYTVSALGDAFPGTLVRLLGLDSFAPLGDAKSYFEFKESLDGLNALARSTNKFEKNIAIRLGIDPDVKPIAAWLMFGAIREDDNPSEDPPTPQDVTPGLKRPLNHFFDPIMNRPLQAAGLELIDGDVHKNPDWAIGSHDSFIDSNTPEPQRRNHFTIMDAREAMFRALTLLTYNGTGYPEIAAGVDAATKEQWRQAYWATTFRVLGDVLHLNQDMAQPQHTRNEPHSGKACPNTQVCLGGHTSVYEKYVNGRALLQDSFSAGAPSEAFIKISPAPLSIASYPTPTFAKYSDFWSTSPGNPTVAGKGLADYSNRGFFTAAKNLDSAEYDSPSRDPSSYTVTSVVPTLWDGTPSTDPTPIHVYRGQVSDQWQGTSATNVALTTYSVWDEFVRVQSGAPAYSLNRINYDAMAELLLPRAVAYSAGLLNFFFRGRIEIALPDEGVFALADHALPDGFKTIRAKVKNASEPFIDSQGSMQSQDMSEGQFFAVLKFHKDRQYVASLDTVVGAPPCTDVAAVVNFGNPHASTECRDGVERIVVSRPVYAVSLRAGEEKLIEFEFGDSPIPFDITDVALQVVYRGELGSEADAVAAGTLDISEPTYFSYQNASEYIHIGQHVYTRGQINADPQLLAQVQPSYCVDYRQTPPKLVDGCLDPFDLDLTVSFGDLANPIAKVSRLQNRRFIRFVYLATNDGSFNPPVLKSAARRVTLQVSRHHPVGKALLYQDGTCIPHDPFVVPTRRAQFAMLAADQAVYRLDEFWKLRGINGWYSSACVVNGDGSPPGTPDDRVDVMTPLTPLSEEVEPVVLTIMPEYL